MRLIDADKLIENMKEIWDMQDLYLPIHFKEFLVDEQPTIFDVEQLEEFKEYKKNKHRSLRYMYEKGYNKAIDDLTEKAMKKFTELDLKDRCPTVTDCKIILRDTAEELKECEE